MTNEKFRECIDHIREYSLDTLLAKNALYAKNSDSALHNFQCGAAIDDSTPAQAAWGYLTKHLVALRDKVKRNDFSDLADLEEKCCDIINYVAILYAIGCNEAERVDSEEAESDVEADSMSAFHERLAEAVRTIFNGGQE